MAAVEAARQKLAKSFTLLDAQLVGKKFLGGTTFTMGDIPVGATAHRWLEIPGIDRPPLEAVRAWRARLAERPAFRNHVQLPLC